MSRIAALATAAAAGSVVPIITAPAPAQAAVAAAACGSGYVALTFDDGPTGSTSALLNALRSAGVRATLFNIGSNVNQNPAAAQAEQAAGMWIGNHSWTHPHMTQLSATQMTSEISQTQQAIQQVTGTTPRLFRPPFGETNATLRSVEAQFGLTEVLWTVDSQDWNGASTSQIVQAANSLQPGGVILMHDGLQTTISAIPQIVTNLSNRGLCAGMISPSTGQAVAPDGTGPTNPPASGSCAVSYRETQRWSDRFNGEVTVRAGSAAITSWTASVTVHAPQKVSATWNGSPTWDSTGNIMTMKPNGNGNLPAGGTTTFGFTVLANGNWSAPSVSCQIP